MEIKREKPTVWDGSITGRFRTDRIQVPEVPKRSQPKTKQTNKRQKHAHNIKLNT